MRTGRLSAVHKLQTSARVVNGAYWLGARACTNK